jgi:putative hydrolase of HD superfamily
MEKEIEDLFRFNELLARFRGVERQIHIGQDDRKENDVEHSYGLAMFAWYIVSSRKLALDLQKVLSYALAHDLVESYAGDVFFFASYKDENVRKQKEEMEDKARLRIAKEFPEFPELHATIFDYIKREDAESRFVYALDKICPILNIYQADGRTWREHKVTLEMLLEGKRSKVAIDPEIEKYFKQIEALLRKEEKRLFY